MSLNDFGQVYDLACKAFALGENLVLTGNDRSLVVKPVFSERAITVDEMESGRIAQGSRKVIETAFNRDEFAGMKVPCEFEALFAFEG